MVPNPTIKIRKRERGLTVYIKVLNYSRAQRLLICFETSEASTLHVTGHLMLKNAKNYAPKENKSDQ